jgi:hypothetical protein
MYRMLTRKQVLKQRWIAAGVMLGLVFVQIVTAAHACPNLAAASDTAVVQPAVGVTASCHDLADKARDNANVCQSHCLAEQQVDIQADAPIAAIAPREALAVHVIDLCQTRLREFSSLPALGAAARPLLRFSRLLN